MHGWSGGDENRRAGSKFGSGSNGVGGEIVRSKNIGVWG